MPVELKLKGYDGKIESVIKVEDVSYVLDDNLSALNITVSGTKTYGASKSGYDIINYKLCDSAGYVVDSGNLFLRDLNAGDKFKEDSITVYDVKPGENYTIKFAEYSF